MHTAHRLRFSRFWLLAVSLVLTGVFSAPAQAQPAAAEAQRARAFVDNIGQEALKLLRNKHLSFEEKRTALEALFARNVDIPWVGRFVLGRFWRQASEGQRARYLQEYERFLITHYTSQFTDYSDGDYTIAEVRGEDDRQFYVSMRIISPQREPIAVDYRLRTNDEGELKVFDIIVEGVSLITTQRSEFGSVVQNRGLDSLIDQLATKTQTTLQKRQG